MDVAAFKTAVFRWTHAVGVSQYLADTEWRRQRLLILCYHGVSLADEHEWNPALYISPRTLARRLEALDRLGCTVLSLRDAVARLYDHTLPNRAVVLTFDDGYFDFKAKALPLLATRKYPATVYVTTERWTGDVNLAHLREAYRSWQRACRRVRPLPSRILSVMTRSEVAEIAAHGIAVEMHTHRHCLPADVQELLEDIRVNRELIASTTGRVPRNFCYPDGVYHRRHLPYLRLQGIDTATTCDPDLAAVSSDPLLMPRFVDCEACSQQTFEAWVTGVACWMPRRSKVANASR